MFKGIKNEYHTAFDAMDKETCGGALDLAERDHYRADSDIHSAPAYRADR
jgi:hypothetical protein